MFEQVIKNMGNAGRNGGEFYTPRPIIRANITVVNPKIGETLCDPAAGSAGFPCEAFEYLKRTNPKRTTAQDRPPRFQPVLHPCHPYHPWSKNALQTTDDTDDTDKSTNSNSPRWTIWLMQAFSGSLQKTDLLDTCQHARAGFDDVQT